MKKIFFFSLFFLTIFLTTSTVFADSVYLPLAPIPGLTDGEGIGSSDKSLSTYFQNLYKFGVGVATALALFMVIYGGVEYVSTDAIGGKEEGKERIQNAIFGMILALSSYIILQTIDRSFTRSDIKMETLEVTVEEIIRIDATVAPNIEQDKTLGNEEVGSQGDLGLVEGQGSSKLVESALKAAGNGEGAVITSTIAGTDGGNKGCAVAGSIMLKNAGYDLGTNYSTIELHNKLKADSRFTYLGEDITQIQPGDIVMAVTGVVNGVPQTGHFAISVGGGSSAELISNRSSQGRVNGGWKADAFKKFEADKGLPLKIFRAK